jgi:hypothetical protein
MNIKKSFLNIVLGIFTHLLILTLGFLIPRLVILNFGSEINGFLSSISQIFIYFTLIEAGLGIATLQSLYKPLSINDYNSINSILSATNKFYLKISKIYFVSLIIFSVVYPIIFKTNLSYLVSVSLILLIGIGNLLSYIFVAAFKILLEADGRSYIIITISNLANLISIAIKLYLLYKGYDVLIIYIFFTLISLIQIIIFHIYKKTKYGWINYSVVPNFEALKQRKAVFVHQISSLIFYNTDIILLTIFTNFIFVSIYSLYKMITDAVHGILSKINNGLLFILGQKFHTSKEQYFAINSAYETYYNIIVFSSYLVLLLFLNSFLSLYLSGIEDAIYIIKYLPFLFVLIKLLDSARAAPSNIINLAGHFSQTQSRSITESTINLITSIVGVIFLGIHGVLVGTVLALIYRTNDIILYANKVVLNRSPIKTYFLWLVNFLLFGIIYFTFSPLVAGYNNFIDMLFGMMVIYILVLSTYFIIISLLFKKDFNYILRLLKNIINAFKSKFAIKKRG